jgi:SAM-dependent methyltransferase
MRHAIGVILPAHQGHIVAGASIDSVWNQGNPYERYVGRWSRPVAAQFLRWLAMPPSLRWLDVGCGTGALASAIVATAEPKEVFAVDPSEGFLSLARQHLHDEATLRLGSATQIPLQDASVDIAVSGLVLNFVPNLADGLAEMKRVVGPGGTIAAYVWDYAEGMQLMRVFWDAAVSLRPEAQALDEGVRFPLCEPAALQAAFEFAGLADVEVAPLTIETPFRDFEDYWSPFLGGQGPAPAYACSLDEASRDALRERLRERLPIRADGSILLHARAFAVKGRRAG